MSLEVSQGPSSKSSVSSQLLTVIQEVLFFHEIPARACCFKWASLLDQSTLMVIPWVILHAFRLVWDRDVEYPRYVCRDVSRGLTRFVGGKHYTKREWNHPMCLEARWNKRKKREKQSEHSVAQGFNPSTW